MAWSTSNRRSELPRDWARIRRRILRRDRGACTNTFSDGRQCEQPATDVDHIVPGNDHSDTNLRSLCGWCHRHKSSSEGGTAAGQRVVSSARPPTTHPALEG
ncbi:HNH endonuclease [Kitasatospora fiedleri]|uniref:HNH endonuclease n=1 Tax=Kitasatospora fiedleri TaxID=2991545 RepID=UPI00249C704F|nr:HNH endonuclease [Kitasatospora fiedleri]